MQILATHGVLGFSNEAWIASGCIADHVGATPLVGGRGVPPSQDPADALQRAETLQALAQQLLLLDRTDDSTECFERCLKEMPLHSRADQQARACLIAGLQSLHRHQLRTGWNCLQRTLDARQAPLSVTVQAHAALGALYFGLGMRRPAAVAVDRGIALLDPGSEAHAMPLAVLEALKVEFLVLDLLRQHERLADLAFWPRHEEMAGARVGVAQAREALDACRRRVAPYAFIAARLDFLDALVALAYQGVAGDSRTLPYIRRLNELGLGMHVHAARHELSLACIAAQRTDLLRQMMLCYTGTGRAASGVEHHLEHRYCLAKLGELGGREDVYIQHYREYASRALVHLRQTCAYITVPSTVRQAVGEIPKDDIASRLPGKYRRAYQFILSNLHREDLSIREVADAVGVTERALQLAFRAALGLSPSAVIRQCRMDRIRDELHRGAVGHGTTTLDVGRRWGLRSRSALSQAYKATFGELPSQTLSASPG